MLRTFAKYVQKAHLLKSYYVLCSTVIQYGLNELIWVRIDLMGTWRFCNQRRRKLGVPTHLGCSGVHPFHCDIIILCSSLALLPLLAVDAAGGRGKHNKAVSWHG